MIVSIAIHGSCLNPHDTNHWKIRYTSKSVLYRTRNRVNRNSDKNHSLNMSETKFGSHSKICRVMTRLEKILICFFFKCMNYAGRDAY